MEKLLLSRLSCLLLIFPLWSAAQEYAVFKVEGKPMLVQTTKKSPVSKGMIIHSGKIALDGKDKLVFLNDKGEIFQLKLPGNYSVENIAAHKKDGADESFSSKYFAYVWREITSNAAVKTNTGNVYRDGLLDLPIAPLDSVSIYKNNITFSWKTDGAGENYYFFLKNKAEKTVSKMKVEGDSLTLFAGSELMEKGNTYYWGVSKKEYPDFTRIKMNQLNYLNEKQYTAKKGEMDKLIQDLKELGFSATEIEEQLCEYFRLCE